MYNDYEKLRTENQELKDQISQQVSPINLHLSNLYLKYFNLLLK